jgi:hypothetical protein
MMFKIACKFHVIRTGEVIALAAMIDLLFFATNTKITVGVAATLEKAIIRCIPATFA